MLPALTSAHGTGLTFTATVTGDNGTPYYIDVDYTEEALVANALGRFDLKLFADESRTEAVAFTDVLIRISKANTAESRGVMLYSGSITKADIGATGFSFMFPESGEYMLTVTYHGIDEESQSVELGEAAFLLEVHKSEGKRKFNFTREFWLGISFGFFISIVAMYLMKSKK